MADDENISSRKRVAEREVYKDKCPDEDSPSDEPELGPFQKKRVVCREINKDQDELELGPSIDSGTSARVSEEEDEDGGEGMEVLAEEDRKEAEESDVNVEIENVEGEEIANAEDVKEAEKSDVKVEREHVEGEKMVVANEQDLKEAEESVVNVQREHDVEGGERMEVANEEDRKEAEASVVNLETEHVEGEIMEAANEEDRNEAEKSDVNVEREHVEGERMVVASEEDRKEAEKSDVSVEGERMEVSRSGREASRSVVGAVPTNNIGSSSTFGTKLTASPTETSKLTMQEVHVETGEENEKTVFASDAILYEFIDGGWKERGDGEVKLNLNRTGDNRARFVMRARGSYRLILNANIYVDMAVKEMGKKGATFVCVNGLGEGQTGPSTFALKFKDEGIRNLFSANVDSLKLRLQICLSGDFGEFDMDLRR